MKFDQFARKARLAIFTMETNLTSSLPEIIGFQWNHLYEFIENIADERLRVEVSKEMLDSVAEDSTFIKHH